MTFREEPNDLRFMACKHYMATQAEGINSDMTVLHEGHQIVQDLHLYAETHALVSTLSVVHSLASENTAEVTLLNEPTALLSSTLSLGYVVTIH